MNIRWSVAVAALVLAGSVPASAQRVSPMLAGRFVQFCQTPRGGGVEICDAYITGMADSFALVQHLPGGAIAGGKLGICVPAEVSGPAMRQRVLSWISAHRDTLRRQVGEVVYSALQASFPCNGGQ